MAGAIVTSAREDWNTPPEMLTPVHEFFRGSIGLDPCWNATALTEPLERFDLSKGQDGLALPWGKRTVFVNPPWGRVISRWVEKAVRETQAGTIMLLPANTDTQAWHGDKGVFANARAICFMEGRVTFLDPETGLPAKAGATKGAAFIYFGQRDWHDFQAVFADYGFIVGRVPRVAGATV